MTDPLRRLERILDRTARAVSGGSLHPLEILERVSVALERGVRDGVAPNEVVVGFQENDWKRVEPVLEDLKAELRAAILEQERGKRRVRMGDLRVTLEASRQAAEGAPQVTTRFVDTSTREPRQGVSNPTRRMLRHQGVTLLISDGRRVPITHTPLTLGRGPENDVVLASLAVSREHAEIVKVADGFAVRDLGSRNGIVVDGERVDHAVLRAGQPVLLGDIQVWLEVAPR
ncbi:MAG: FhaA domain-containing protein [Dehalococcoidia bacterium]